MVLNLFLYSSPRLRMMQGTLCSSNTIHPFKVCAPFRRLEQVHKSYFQLLKGIPTLVPKNTQRTAGIVRLPATWVTSAWIVHNLFFLPLFALVGCLSSCFNLVTVIFFKDSGCLEIFHRDLVISYFIRYDVSYIVERFSCSVFFGLLKWP